ncbi:type IX secretion system membrane protein PorP/SprF, partial [uncultured Olleya sp.]
MKKIVYIVFLVFIGVQAQQDPQYTQYMYNMNVVNPAYAGSTESVSIGALYRSQWVGLEGAPTTGTLAIHSPVG